MNTKRPNPLDSAASLLIGIRSSGQPRQPAALADYCWPGMTTRVRLQRQSSRRCGTRRFTRVVIPVSSLVQRLRLPEPDERPADERERVVLLGLLRTDERPRDDPDDLRTDDDRERVVLRFAGV
jgi:hypothetical protein